MRRANASKFGACNGTFLRGRDRGKDAGGTERDRGRRVKAMASGGGRGGKGAGRIREARQMSISTMHREERTHLGRE